MISIFRFLNWRFCLLSLVLVSSTFELIAQRDNLPKLENPTKKTKTPLAKKGSKKIRVYSIDHLDDNRSYQDTLLENFHIFDPILRNLSFDVHKGNPGSSVYSLDFELKPIIGLDIGLHQYDKYRKSRQEVPLLDVDRPFFHGSFTPTNGQANFIIDAKFAKKFVDNSILNIDYQRLNNEGFYNNQDTKSTYFATTLHKTSDNHDLIVQLLVNNQNELQNGGITDPNQLPQALYQLRSNVSTHLAAADTRYAQSEISVINYYHLTDTVQNKLLSFRHELVYNNSSYRFSDDNISASDSLFYGNYANDLRGIRHYIKDRMIENSFYIHRGQKEDFLSGYVGISHQWHRLDNDIETNHIHIAKMIYDLNVNPLSKLRLSSNGEIGVVNRTGDFHLDNQLKWQTTESLKLQAGISLFRYTPSFIQRELVLNQNLHWTNAFEKPYGSQINAKIDLPRLRLQLSAKYTLLDNPIYANQNALFEQASSTLKVSQIQLSHHWKWGFFNFKNAVFYQRFSENLYALPELFSEHQLYLEFRPFKRRMLLQLGLNTRLLEKYKPLAYHPVLGIFHPQDEYSQKISYFTDAFINFKIKGFRCFFKFENLNELFLNEATFYTNRYPLLDNRVPFRLGISWMLYD